MDATILGALLEVSSWGCFRGRVWGRVRGFTRGCVQEGVRECAQEGCSGGVWEVFGRYIATAVGLHIFIILLPTRADGLSVPLLNSWWRARGKKFQRYRGRPD